MKVSNRKPVATADASAARGAAWRELLSLVALLGLIAVGVYFMVGAVVDFTVARISYDTEKRLFGSFDLGSAVVTTGEGDSLARAAEILRRLTPDPRVPPLDYRLVRMELPDPNAFAFPGGTIALTSALLDVLDDEIALAFVLGHELGHFRHRDHLRGLGRAAGAGLIYAFLFQGEMGSRTVQFVLQQVLARGYSRGQEDAADRFAVALVYRVYGKTQGMDRLFRLLRDKDERPGWAFMFSTHPSPAARIENLHRYAEQLSRQSPPARAPAHVP